MGKTNISTLLKKAEEYQLISIIQDMIEFVQEIKPTLENINYSIAENINKMPAVNSKLTKVNEATEIATIEILNILDGLFAKVDTISSGYMKIVNDGKYLYVKTQKLLNDILLLNDESQKLKSFGPDIEILINEINERVFVLDNIENLEVIKILGTLNEDMTSIMMSLQVQDITSQQIAAVKHLLDTIRLKLASILSRFNTTELQNIINESEIKSLETAHANKSQSTFDPDAIDSITMNVSRQKIVDDIIEKQAENINDSTDSQMTEDSFRKNNNDESFSILTNDDIESLKNLIVNESLAQGKQEEQTFPAHNSEENESFSQDDIDALFGK